jgi:hypothetical protein
VRTKAAWRSTSRRTPRRAKACENRFLKFVIRHSNFNLNLGFWMFSGAWTLEFGAFAPKIRVPSCESVV